LGEHLCNHPEPPPPTSQQQPHYDHLAISNMPPLPMPLSNLDNHHPNLCSKISHVYAKMTNELHMMRVVQMTTKQDVVPFHRTLLYVMDGLARYETTTNAKEQVCIVRGQVRQSI
jgi:hypothetical protein